jgi:hypothetical protein
MNMQISYAHWAFKTPMGIFDGVGILDSMGGHLMCNEPESSRLFLLFSFRPTKCRGLARVLAVKLTLRLRPTFIAPDLRVTCMNVF